jgi:hypothetical protein
MWLILSSVYVSQAAKRVGEQSVMTDWFQSYWLDFLHLLIRVLMTKEIGLQTTGCWR